ncbi:MAG: GNAT family N-acetyltransferase [Bacillota bacterium]
MLNGKLVRLRHQSFADQAIIADFLNKEHIMEVRGYETPRFTYREQLEKKYKERFERHNDNDFHLIIETSDGKVIGAIGVDFVFWKNGFAYMYQYIGDTEYLSGGYREEAIRLFTEFAFLEGNIRKIKTSVPSNDLSSMEAFKAAGYEIEITHVKDVLVHGKYIDVYEMVKFNK